MKPLETKLTADDAGSLKVSIRNCFRHSGRSSEVHGKGYSHLNSATQRSYYSKMSKLSKSKRNREWSTRESVQEQGNETLFRFAEEHSYSRRLRAPLKEDRICSWFQVETFRLKVSRKCLEGRL